MRSHFWIVDKPVGDDQRRPVLHYALDGLLDKLLGLGVDRARRFVQDQDRRVERQRPCERDKLLLPDRKPGTAFVDLEFVYSSFSFWMNSSA